MSVNLLKQELFEIIRQDFVPTSQSSRCISVTNISRLILFRGKETVLCGFCSSGTMCSITGCWLPNGSRQRRGLILQGQMSKRTLACWDCGFESRRGNGCLSLVNVAWCAGRVLCVGLITRPEESYRVWCVWCGSEASITRRPLPTSGCCPMEKNSIYFCVLRF
jgi:hypothetical protein